MKVQIYTNTRICINTSTILQLKVTFNIHSAPKFKQKMQMLRCRGQSPCGHDRKEWQAERKQWREGLFSVVGGEVEVEVGEPGGVTDLSRCDSSESFHGLVAMLNWAWPSDWTHPSLCCLMSCRYPPTSRKPSSDSGTLKDLRLHIPILLLFISPPLSFDMLSLY